jgi:hypothetical protein
MAQSETDIAAAGKVGSLQSDSISWSGNAIHPADIVAIESSGIAAAK